MDPHHQNFFVIGAIENADRPAPRQARPRAPEKIVLQLLLARRLEAVHLASLRIDPGHHVLDDAVLAGRVHTLQHDQHCPTILRVKPLLQIREPGNAVGEHRLDVVLVDARPNVSAGSQSARRKWPGLSTRQCFRILESFIFASRLRASGSSPPGSFQIGNHKSRHAVVEVGASADNMDVAEFRPRLAREIAHDLSAKLFRILPAT